MKHATNFGAPAVAEYPDAQRALPRRLLVTRRRGALIITLALGFAVAVATALFFVVDSVGGFGDMRATQSVTIFAAVIGVMWLASMIRMFR